jgi:hypothetical protein
VLSLAVYVTLFAAAFFLGAYLGFKGGYRQAVEHMREHAASRVRAEKALTCVRNAERMQMGDVGEMEARASNWMLN